MFNISWLQKHANEIVLGVMWIISIILLYSYYTTDLEGLNKLLLMMIACSIGAVTIIFTIGYFALRAGYTKAKADAELAKLEDDYMSGGKN